MLDSSSSPSELPIVEEFYTLQGEGFWSGHAAYFIRIAGCDVGCPWCDTKVSWKASSHKLKTVDELVANATSFPAAFAVITGGEPLMHNLDLLCRKLQEAGVRTALETSGVYPISGTWDWICLSPKTFKLPLPEIFEIANELKIVISEVSDLEWAVENSKKVNPNCILYLQPEWSVFRTILPSLVYFVKENPRFRVSLQSHKFMRIP